MCAGECGEGLEGGLFSCGGCGGEAAQGVDGRMSPPSTAAIALQSERCGIMSRCPHAPAPPVESSWAWTV